MARTEIYTTPFCAFCLAAKHLLRQKGVNFIEIDVSRDAQARKAMTLRAHGRRTVPQIFIEDRHIGGFEELHSLEGQGQLDPLLQQY